MTTPFDPDAYLQQPGGAPTFDPATYLAGPRPQVSALESAARAYGQGATLNTGDELLGLTQAATELPAPLAVALSPLSLPLKKLAELTSGVPSALTEGAARVDEEKARVLNQSTGSRFLARLRGDRDAERQANEDARAANPMLYGAANIAGSLPLAIATGGGAAPTLGRSVAAGTGLGAASGLGASEADLTRGEVGQAALDTAIGGGTGAAAGAAGYGLGQAFRKVAGKAGDALRKATADYAQKVTQARQAAFRSARSALGGEAAAAANELARARAIVANVEGKFPAEVVEQAKAYLASPEAVAAEIRAAENLVRAGPARLTGSMQTAENAMDAAAKELAPESIEAAVDQGMAHPIKTQVLPRLWNYLSRVVPVAVGSSVGGPAGAAAGMATGAVMGNPGTALRNMLLAPAVRGMAARGVGGAAHVGAESALPAALTSQQALINLLLQAQQEENAPNGP